MSTIDKAMAKLKGLKTDEPKASPSTPEDDNSTAKAETAKPDSSPVSAKLIQEEIKQVESQEQTTSPQAEKTEKRKPVETSEAVDKRDAPQPKTHKALVQEEISEPVQTAKRVADTEKKEIVDSDNGRTSQNSVIDIELLTKKGFITQQNENRQLKEQFRAVKRKLLNNAFGAISKTLHHPNLIIVSSCNPNEGKTFSSINLALSIALEQDKTVLLVDADVLRPNVVRELGVPPVSGLTEFLSGQITDVSEIIHNTNIENFKFIPAGTPHDLSTELLASEKMAKLTEELASRYSDRVVIFDAPPLLGVNETHIMANLVGQAVIVVEENKTRLNDVQVAVEQLEKKLAIGFLVNKSRGEAKDQYGYGYGYYRKD
ncbi:XrtA-associated tyrosine autokinase [Hahella ganghwensis]|uniref:XrtA-associated tyrosine autokinase n=1 Tax=Hahella ganghwensis TaxID=286420 RepID=UPI00037BAA52|nr:XrtA-associated tyrosine autokinase [Hahella ganghwensis]